MCILQTEKVSLRNSRANEICPRMEKDQLTCTSDAIACLMHTIFKTIVVYITVDENFATENAAISILLGQNVDNYVQNFLPMFSKCFCAKKPEIYRN